MFALVKLILTFFSDEPKLPLILKAGTSPNIKKLFLLLTAWDDELLSPRKIIIFLVFWNYLNDRKCKRLQFRSSNCFVLHPKDLYQTLFLFLIQKVLCYGRKRYIMG